MLTIDELNLKLLSELRKIAEKFGVKDHGKLSKKELVYKILSQQAVMPAANGGASAADAAVEEPKKKRTRRAVAAGDDAEEADDQKTKAPARRKAPAKVSGRSAKPADKKSQELDTEAESGQLDFTEDLGKETAPETTEPPAPQAVAEKETAEEQKDSSQKTSSRDNNDGDSDRKSRQRGSDREKSQSREDQTNKIKRNYNNYVREFDGLITNEGRAGNHAGRRLRLHAVGGLQLPRQPR